MRKFSQRHYVEIADILLQTRPVDYELGSISGSQWRSMVEEFIERFEADSSKFNKKKFYFAIGLIGPAFDS